MYTLLCNFLRQCHSFVRFVFVAVAKAHKQLYNGINKREELIL